MKYRSMAYRFFSVAAIALVLATFTFADTIRLKDGSLIKGRITGFNGGRFTVTVGEGPRRRQITFTAGEVESIQFDMPSNRSETVASVPAHRNSAVTAIPPARNQQPPRPIATPSPRDEPEVIEEVEEVESVPSPTQQVPVINASSGRKPIELSVKVLADNTANGWTNSGWVVKRGQRIKISGEGEVSLGRGQKSTPSGLYDLEDPQKLLKNVPTGALLAVIGDDNNEFIYIGSEREFTATRDGTLFLGLNEGNLNDNSGSFAVKIAVFADDK